MEAARDAGNAEALMGLIFSMGAKTSQELVKESLGDLPFFYYQYMHTFKRPPVDIDDMVDGIIYLELKVYFENKAIRENK